MMDYATRSEVQSDMTRFLGCDVKAHKNDWIEKEMNPSWSHAGGGQTFSQYVCDCQIWREIGDDVCEVILRH